MSKRYDAMTPRKGKEDKTFWHRVGTAFENDKGVTLYLDSYPVPDADGRVAIMLFEPKARSAPRDDAGQSPF